MITHSSYSTTVRGWLVIGEQRFELAQVGPTDCIVRNPIDLPPSRGELAISVDGHINHHPVFLTHGLSRHSPTVALIRE